SRGDDAENWQEAPMNLPLTVGDRLLTGGDGHIELQIAGSRVYVAPETQLTTLDLRDDVAQLSISAGTATFHVDHLSDGQVIEVDTPNVSVTLRGPGRYRFDVGKDGN